MALAEPYLLCNKIRKDFQKRLKNIAYIDSKCDKWEEEMFNSEQK